MRTINEKELINNCVKQLIETCECQDKYRDIIEDIIKNTAFEIKTNLIIENKRLTKHYDLQNRVIDSLNQKLERAKIISYVASLLSVSFIFIYFWSFYK